MTLYTPVRVMFEVDVPISEEERDALRVDPSDDLEAELVDRAADLIRQGEYGSIIDDACEVRFPLTVSR